MTALFFLSSLIACGDKDTEETGAEAGFEAGTFLFTNQAVDDQCLDGGFNVLFIPDGTANDWQNPVELPAESDLPYTYTIPLQEPFSSLEATVTSGGDGILIIEEATQEDVLFDENTYADCVIDLSIQANITIIDNDNVNGVATLPVVSFEGETCPLFNDSPCDIVLDFTGARQ